MIIASRKRDLLKLINKEDLYTENMKILQISDGDYTYV